MSVDFIREIIFMEWRLWDQAGPCRGHSPCQWDGFSSMRASQLLAWNQKMRESYYRDLQMAEAEGRNPMWEQTGYLLERTNPAEYEAIRAELPERSLEKDYLLDWICQAHAAWQEELAKQYPRLTGQSRRNSDGTSFVACLWAELTACSVPTLRLYAAYVEKLQKIGMNLNQMILLNLAAEYGWASLEEAEQCLTRSAVATMRRAICVS